MVLTPNQANGKNEDSFIRQGRSTGSHNVLFVGLDRLEGVLTDGDVLLHEHILPDGVHGKVLGLVHEHEAGGEVTLDLGLIGEVHGLQQGGQHGLGGGAETDGPAGHAVDGGVEEVQTHGHVAVEVAHAHLVHDGHEAVVLNENMVGVPMQAAGDVEHEVADEGTVGRELVRDVLGGVEVTRVEGDTAVMGGGVAQVELMGADDKCLGTDAEDLTLQDVGGVLVLLLGVGGAQDLVQGLNEQLAVAVAVHGDVLQAVGDPDVIEALLTQLFTHGQGDLAAVDTCLDPVVAGGLIQASQGEAVVHHGVGEEGGIVVQTVAVLLGEVHPVAEVLNGQVVTGISALGVHTVEVDLVLEGGEGEGHLDIRAELVTGLGGVGVAARDQVLGLHVAQTLQARDVVALPAMEGHGDGVELLQHLVGVHAVLGVLVAGVLVGFDDSVLIHGGGSFLGWIFCCFYYSMDGGDFQ